VVEPNESTIDNATICSYISIVSNIERILDTIHKGGILTLRDAEAVLKHWGYVRYSGKGSHQNWKHPERPLILTIATHAKEVPRYITRALRKLMEDA